MAGLERQQHAAPQSGLDQGLDHLLGGQRGQETLVLARGTGAGLSSDHLG